MQKICLKAALIVLAISLTGCSGGIPGFSSFSGNREQAAEGTSPGLVGKSVDEQGNEKNVNITMTGGGEIGMRSMDAEDKTKMSRALDAGTGKPTHWQNGITGISYTVTPTKKVVIQGNPFCREYSVVLEKGTTTKSMDGTACVTTDGLWHAI